MVSDAFKAFCRLNDLMGEHVPESAQTAQASKDIFTVFGALQAAPQPDTEQVIQDAMLHGVGVSRNGKRIAPEDHRAHPDAVAVDEFKVARLASEIGSTWNGTFSFDYDDLMEFARALLDQEKPHTVAVERVPPGWKILDRAEGVRITAPYGEAYIPDRLSKTGDLLNALCRALLDQEKSK